MDPDVTRDLGRRFMRLMEERRARAPGGQETGGGDGSSAVATATAADTTAGRGAGASGAGDELYRLVVSLSLHPARYERAGLQSRALAALDLGLIYGWADEIARAEPALGHQDCVVKGLLRLFKTGGFFRWVTTPACARCGGETVPVGMAAPTAEEARRGAGRVELYRCQAEADAEADAGVATDATTAQRHGPPTRFPRYDDPETLLEWRQGRCGEWANCFTLCCLALGMRARWVWNAEDHVWTEVYSQKLGRWVHCDSCEEAFDEPQIYAVGWGKKMSYCLAFSSEGAQDVTRRYVRTADQALPRTRGSEESLKRAIRDINNRCRSSQADALRVEDEEEEKELASYVTEPTPTVPGEERPRESGSEAWKEARGETGRR